MKTRIIASIIALVVLYFSICIIFESTVVSVAGQNPTYSKDELISLIEKSQTTKDTAHTMANCARQLGWAEDDDLIKELGDIWNKADKEQKTYQAKLDIILQKEKEEKPNVVEAPKKEEKPVVVETPKKEEPKPATTTNTNASVEYPAATYVWNYMKAQGWNDYVCAGIMGNLMAEVGGQTLNLNYSASSSNYYGMCQWNRNYKQVWGADLPTQCNFLRDTIKYEIDTYGFKYQKGFNFNSFLNMTNARQAALAFAKSYERCGSGSYEIRQRNAEKAYEYFVK